jgi:Ca2+/Na+ antiporter
LPWLMMRKNFTVTRKDGFILLFCYFGYLAYLIVEA